MSPGPSASGLAEDGGASGADDNGLGVAEDSGDPEVSEYVVSEIPPLHQHSLLPVAAGALDIHEVTVRMLNEPLQLVPPLFFSGKRVQ